MLGDRVGPSPLTKMNKVEIFLLETLVLHIGFRLSFDALSIMYLYWEQTTTHNYYGIKYSLYVADVFFRDFVNIFRNVGGAQPIVANINFQVNLFNLEQSGRTLPNRTIKFEPPPMVRCQYASREKKTRLCKLRT